MYYDESYVNRRAVRKPVSPELRKRDRRLALLEAQSEMDLAEKANREGNHRVARMILESVKGKLAYAEGRKYAPARRRAQRPDAVLSDAELRSVQRRLQLIRAEQN